MSQRIVFRKDGKVYLKDGVEVSKEEWMGKDKTKEVLESGSFNTISTGWPFHSDALGVHPDQAKEAYAESVAMGCPTKFDSEGRAILESREHRKKYCEANGMFDRDGGYGDAQPKNVTSKKRNKRSTLTGQVMK